MIDFSKHLFRCSSLGLLMTNKQGKKDTKTIDELSDTAKGELIKIYIEAVYGRKKEIKSKYLEKGTDVEDDSITLLARIKDTWLAKNKERRSNEFITGEPDLLKPLRDIKSCWDLHTFFDAKTKPLDKRYEWQIRGYCELFDEPEGTVAFCLTDTPLGLIEDEKRKLFYRMNVPTMENPDYMEACEALEKEMTFGDIPMVDRIHEITVKRSPELINMAYERIVLCREWLNEFANQKVLA